jgi:trehalose synthase
MKRPSNNSLQDMMTAYRDVTSSSVIHQLEQLAAPLRGAKVLHINSTGGGVAEILHKLIPLKQALGIEADWEIITGNQEFYQCTKGFHNALQGMRQSISEKLLRNYEKTNKENGERLKSKLKEADFVFIHDPQPAPLLKYTPERRGKWIWRQPLPHAQYIIPPSIDPLSEKNCPLPVDEIKGVYTQFNLDPELPMITQVSRYDRFKDPLGVIEAYKLASKLTPLQLVLAGGGASDDPEGEAVLNEVKQASNGAPNIHVLLLPADANRTINALQRASDIILQKSIREGFGLTVSEGMWKGKPVIGGDTGGIRLQVIDHYTGFLVRTPEGAALRTRYLLHRRDKLEEMGMRAKRFVRENFLITRHLREYLTLMVGLTNGSDERINVGNV